MYSRTVLPNYGSLFPDMTQLPTQRGGAMLPPVQLPQIPQDKSLMEQMTPLLGMLGAAKKATNTPTPPIMSDDPSAGGIMGLLRGGMQPGGFLTQFSSNPWLNVNSAYNLSNIF